MKKVLLLVAVVTAAVPASAQMAGMAAPNTAVGTARSEWQQIGTYIAKAADQIPETDYAFRPTPEVRTFAQLIGHIAGAQFMICSAALGEPSRAEDEFEKGTHTKAALVAALKSSTEYCGRAYAQSDAASTGTTKLFGSETTRLAALMRNAVHNGEHYGNIVTYMRIKGMVPPSSQPSPPTR